MLQPLAGVQTEEDVSKNTPREAHGKNRAQDLPSTSTLLHHTQTQLGKISDHQHFNKNTETIDLGSNQLTYKVH